MILVHEDFQLNPIVHHRQHTHDFKAAEMCPQQNTATTLVYLLERNIDTVRAQVEALMVTSNEIRAIEYRAGKRVEMTHDIPPAHIPVEHAR